MVCGDSGKVQLILIVAASHGMERVEIVIQCLDRCVKVHKIKVFRMRLHLLHQVRLYLPSADAPAVFSPIKIPRIEEHIIDIHCLGVFSRLYPEDKAEA